MKISEIASILNAKCVQDNYEDIEITSVYTGDLLSDVMAYASEDGVLVTIQAHKNTLAVATLKDLRAVIICNNRPIPEDMIEAAKEEEIALFLTKENQFTVSGKLYKVLEKKKRD